MTYDPQGRRAEGTGVQLLSLAKLEDYLTVRARLARLKGRIINCVAIARDRGSERGRKACGPADYPIGPCGALLRCIAHAIARLAERDRRTTY